MDVCVWVYVVAFRPFIIASEKPHEWISAIIELLYASKKLYRCTASILSSFTWLWNKTRCFVSFSSHSHTTRDKHSLSSVATHTHMITLAKVVSQIFLRLIWISYESKRMKIGRTNFVHVKSFVRVSESHRYDKTHQNRKPNQSLVTVAVIFICKIKRSAREECWPNNSNANYTFN